MDKAGFLRKLRLFLADPDGKVWDDIELNTFLDEALKKYCIDSGCLVGEFPIAHDENGIYHYPKNFCKFMIGWNIYGEEIIPSNARELFIRSNNDSRRRGKIEYIYNDLSSHGDFSLYPNPIKIYNPERINIPFSPDYGEILDNEYGVYLVADYGTTLTITTPNIEYAGTIYYYKTGNYEDVKDYMAVICYALHLAYNADSDFANPDLAVYWKDIYNKRLGVLGRILHNNTGREVTVNFY